ncbi:MAG: hypothetical protein HQK53_11955 [Oligoflexia bacterium]|nr:hypothetical protein [Oligoflexia bacterium]
MPNFYPFSNVNPNIGSILTLGSGYDPVSGSSMGDCVEASDARKVHDGQSSVYGELNYVEDYRSLAESLSISSSINLKIGIPGFSSSVNGSANFFKSQKIEENAVYFMVKVVVESPVEKMRGVQLKEQYAALLRGPGGIKSFRKRCGDEYVRGIQRGGTFYALVKITTRSEEDKRNFQQKLQIKVGKYLTGARSMQTALDEIVKDHSVAFYIFQEGGLIPQIPFSVDNITPVFEHAERFAENINATGGGALIRSITEPYDLLDNYPVEVLPIELENAQQVIESLSTNRYSSLDAISKIENIIDHPYNYIFTSDTEQKLNFARDQYVTNLQIINKFAVQCFRDYEKM